MSKFEKFDIYDRAFSLALRIGKLIMRIPRDISNFEYFKQIIASSGSIGANIQEADGALTKKDFINKMGIARREARETLHWLKLVKGISSLENQKDNYELEWLLGECKEILLFLSSIINNTKRNI